MKVDFQVDKGEIIEFFSNCQCGILLYVMVRRLPNSFVCECLGCFRYLCGGWLCDCIYTSVEEVEDFMHKNAKNMHTQIYLADF